jgi:hypothetical protein
LDQNHQPSSTTATSSPAWTSKPRRDPDKGMIPREGGMAVDELMQRIPAAT